MIIYQVSISISSTVEAEWLAWMKTKHVPDLIATGLISSYHILKPQSNDHKYVFNYHFRTQADYELYHKDHGPKLKADVIERYDGQFTAEREIYEIL